MSCRVVVLLSGRGSNLDALLRTVHVPEDIPVEIVGVISNRPGARGLELARAAGVTSATLDHRRYPDREAFEAVLATTIDALAPDLLVLAGFMRVLSPAFVGRYSPNMLNIHPSLLPEFRGLDTHARVLARNDPVHGASVHVVVPEIDAGPVVAQVAVPVHADDTPATLAERVQQGEHLLYPRVLKCYAAGRIELSETEVRLDGQALPTTGVRFHLDRAGNRLEP